MLYSSPIQQIQIRNVIQGVAAGIVLLGVGFALWYYIFVFLAGQRRTEDILRAQRIEAQFRKDHCTSEAYASEFVRDVCAGKVRF